MWILWPFGSTRCRRRSSRASVSWRKRGVLGDFYLRDRVAMDFVGTVGEAQRAPACRRRQSGSRRTCAAAVGLDGQSSTVQATFGATTLIIAISALRPVADRVHHPCRLERQEPRLVDHAACVGNALLPHGLARHGTAKARGWPAACTSVPARARPARSSACSGGCARVRAGPVRSRSRRLRRRMFVPERGRSRTGSPCGRAARRRSRTHSAAARPSFGRVAGTRIIDCCW